MKRTTCDRKSKTLATRVSPVRLHLKRSQALCERARLDKKVLSSGCLAVIRSVVRVISPVVRSRRLTFVQQRDAPLVLSPAVGKGAAHNVVDDSTVPGGGNDIRIIERTN